MLPQWCEIVFVRYAEMDIGWLVWPYGARRPSRKDNVNPAGSTLCWSGEAGVARSARHWRAIRDDAQLAELPRRLPEMTGQGWPPVMRMIARRDRPTPGAQLRADRCHRWRITRFVTNTLGDRLAELELRHRQPAPKSASAP
jgi:hypothetical protein